MNDLRLRRNGSETVRFMGSPMFRAQAWALLDAYIHGSRFHVTSGDRRRGIAEKYGKMSQVKLSWCYQTKLRTGHCPDSCHGNCFPANRPGHSSHELRGDGVFGADGHPLPWFELGIDANDDAAINDCTRLVAKLRHCGYSVKQPYPDGREKHHFNFTKDPRKNARRRLMKWVARHPIEWARLRKQFG